MGDKRSENELRNPWSEENDTGGRYTPERYFDNSRRLGRARSGRNPEADDQDLYDEYYSGKQENFKGDGYYGSNYGSISEPRRGRDYEDNAGYRGNYEDLPVGQWPEIERAATSRGINLHEYELAQRGVHRGKGPKNYQRADQRITDDINDLLTDDPYIDASEIEFTVSKGDVTVTV